MTFYSTYCLGYQDMKKTKELRICILDICCPDSILTLTDNSEDEKLIQTYLQNIKKLDNYIL